jgi:hypothetical protein
MKRNIFRQIARALIIGFAHAVRRSDHTWAQAKQPQLRQSVELKFEEYRTAIRATGELELQNKMPEVMRTEKRSSTMI